MKASLLPRRRLTLALALSAALPALAQPPGQGPVTIVVPFAAGGATDIVARILAEELQRRWGGRSVVVENKPGAGGALGTEAVAKARADGSVLLLGTQTGLAVNPVLLLRLGYVVERDFAPITLLASTPLVLLAGPRITARDARELMAQLKARPDALSYGSSGNGTSQHLTMLMMLNRLEARAVHVPYKGSSQSLTDLGGGQIDLLFDNLGTALAFAKTGKARALAVTTAQRTELAPELPTVAEAGLPGFEAATWLGLLAPAGTPEPVQAALQIDVTAAMAAPAVAVKLAAQGFITRTNTGAEFRRFIEAEQRRFAELIKANRVTVD
jgi:tripartite-type tricarboxylate transporter receptor subunit TctC